MCDLILLHWCIVRGVLNVVDVTSASLFLVRSGSVVGVTMSSVVGVVAVIIALTVDLVVGVPRVILWGGIRNQLHVQIVAIT